MSERTLRARLYLRLSSTEGADPEASLDAQEAALRSLCAREGFEVVAVYRERAGTSAFKGGHRPEWSRLLAEVERGDVVLAVEASRFSRDLSEGAAAVKLLRQRGAHVVTLADDTRSGGTFSLKLRLLLAEEESRQKSERLVRAKALHRSQGRHLGGPIPFGWRLVDGRLVAEPDEAAIIRRMADMVLGGMSLMNVCRTLEAEGVTRRGRRWRQSSVHATLTQPAVVGWQGSRGRPALGADGRPLPGPEPILDVATWRRVKATLASRASDDGRRRRGTGRSTLLGGLARCGVCGGAMVPEGRAYRCHATDHMNSMTKSVLDDLVTVEVLSTLRGLDPAHPLVGVVAERLAAPSVREEDAAARAAVVEAEEALEALDAALLAGGFTGREDAYARLAAALNARLQAARAALAAEPAVVDVSWVSGTSDMGPFEVWDGLGLDDRRALLRAALDAVVVGRARGRGDRHPERRVSLRWAVPVDHAEW